VPQARILLISPSFFGYEQAIQTALGRYGIVDLFDERPGNSSLVKAAIRVGDRAVQRLTAAHFRGILKQTRGRRYTTVLIVKAELTPAWFVEELRARQPGAEFLFYAFDAIPDGSNPTRIVPLMDRAYSFDARDVARYPGLQLKHLFYTPEFNDPPPQQRRHSLAFVGTLHSDRYAFTRAIFAGRERTFAYFYVQARWYFFFQKYITRSARDVSWREVSFAKLPLHGVAEVFRNSEAVLDLQRSAQSGLTMRTFEVLASGAHLITANASIRDADFYDPRHITVVEDYSTEAVRDLIDHIDAAPGRPHGFTRYSLDNWVLDFVHPRRDQPMGGSSCC